MNHALNRFRLGQLNKILGKINGKEEQYRLMSDADLQSMTEKFKQDLAAGKTLDELLPDAYAVVREASDRVLHMKPYDVQVLGGIVLHQGRIAEMKTGEGKTLVASMPLYLNALEGKGCMLVTTNAYLAARDGRQLQELFSYLGVSLAIGVPEELGQHLTTQQKQQIYASDIVYTTNTALCFDYLLDNLADSLEGRFLRDLHYCIVDEADAVLLDSAQMPLIISGAPRVQSNLFETAEYFVSTLQEGRDFETKDKSVWLTEEGMDRAQRFYRTENLYDAANADTVRHINLALQARMSFTKEKEYVVEENEVRLLDASTGRIMQDTKLRSGMHQAIEAKEHTPITQEKRAMASITYQDFFHLFEKLGGMTGTGASDEGEFMEAYGLDVVVVPTRKGVNRKDYQDRVYSNAKAQVEAAMKEILEVHGKGQPVLVITNTITMAKTVSDLLLQEGIPHNVLDAHHVAKEAEIITEAGSIGAVTVATAVAGRGTDIKLTTEVKKIGGLAVIGIGRMDNVRLEMQARGRAGRQGDPGFSRFYISAEDDVAQDHGDERLEKVSKHGRRILTGRVGRAISRAQHVNEDIARAQRKSMTDIGKSMQIQRQLIYKERDRITRMTRLDPDFYRQIFKDVIEDFVSEQEREGAFQNGGIAEEVVNRFALDYISYRYREHPTEKDLQTADRIKRYLILHANHALEEKMRLLSNEETALRFNRVMLLGAIDSSWVEEVDYLQQLGQSISGRQYAQRNLTHEYHKEALRGWNRIVRKIKYDTMKNVLLGEVVTGSDGKTRVIMP